MRLFFVHVPDRVAHLIIVAGVAALGGVVGSNLSFGTTTREFPLPHQISKYEGGISLRLAMVHDVIHERYPWHGPAYYEERNRRARTAIDADDARRPPGAVPTAAYFALKDDLGVGLERLDRHEEAVAVMREKLLQQEAAGLTGRDLYSTQANLGTILILWQIKQGFADVAAARARLKEGLALVRESIDVNPEAHFGREEWQAVLLEFLLASFDDPSLVARSDMIGDLLERTPHRGTCLRRHSQWGTTGFTWQAARELGWPNYEMAGMPRVSREVLRAEIRRVGAEYEASPVHEAPFDEPTLGIVGMWRYGGGANPHFALALGEIMLRVGQRYIAWCAYERAVQLREHFASDPLIVEALELHCRDRQNMLESQMPAEDRAELRPRFDSELAFGKRYQAAYQDYESKRIREGASIDDEHFYDAFEAEHPSIASPVGSEDRYLAEYKHPQYSIILFAGLFAFGTGCLLRLSDWFARRSRADAPTSAPSHPPTAAPPGTTA
jgi:hypothetical protein